MQQQNTRTTHTNDFNAIQMTLAAPETILEWSWGEVTKPETINYRTQRPEKGGLFDEKIFGPEKDYECYCGKYRGVRYRGIVCEKCGVEITRSVVRRERMGHIELSTPVAHIWYLRSIPSRISLILGLSAADVERVIYFAGYIITKVYPEERDRLIQDLDAEYKAKLKDLTDDNAKTKLKEMFATAKDDINYIQEGRVLDEATYHRYSVKYGAMFEADIGAEAIYNIFKQIDVSQLREQIEEQYEKAPRGERDKVAKRLSLVRSMEQAGIRPEWMFLTRIPVTPPALRPMVPLEGGRHATSDVNDLYRRVINRNNRLKKLGDIGAPAVILRNEKRILQEAVDALLDNSIRHGSQTVTPNQPQRRPLKSLADYLKGKQGYFRQNLLGKRVDYSGRSVIVVGPDLGLNECGLPKYMARELFRPFIIAGLIEQEIAFNIRGANRLIDEGIPEVWALLENIIQDKFVMLNRPPTLHRQGIQAFRPKLIEGSAIQLHPLVCQAFNADFDGDQMAVHVPLSEEAQMEAREYISAGANILKPGTGEVVATPRQDMVLGIYWMTKTLEGANGEGKAFATPNQAIMAYDFGQVSMQASIKVLPTDTPKYAEFDDEPFDTTVGRLLFNSVLPKDFPFVNKELKKKEMGQLITTLVERYGITEIGGILDKIKDFGFKYATRSGTTWGMDDVEIPEEKEGIIAEARSKSGEVTQQYEEGLLSATERYRKNIEIWHEARNQIEEVLPNTLDPDGSANDMIVSGARGSISQMNQMAGMRGLISNPSGETIEFPIVASMKEGLSPIDYFVTTHGSRKGLTDTALQTARAGYLTRRLFDVSQDIVVTEEDCGTKEGVTISRKSASGVEISLAKNVAGRTLTADVKTPDGTKLLSKGRVMNQDDAREIEEREVEAVEVRSPMTCASLQGVCRYCYGWDITTNELIDLGEAVGTVAAQAIGEPGTQLTMRTFQAGGVATTGGDITQGLPRVEEIFDKRAPKHPAVVASVNGTVSSVEAYENEKRITVLADSAKGSGKNASKEVTYSAHYLRVPLVSQGDTVKKGDILTDGSASIDELFKHGGREAAQEYIINEINKIYEMQGAAISRKHIEVVIKQMFARRRVKDPGDTTFVVGDIVEEVTLHNENQRVTDEGGEPASVEPLVLGITEVALSRKSFLSASSFQNTTRILINASLKGAIDHLTGLKENVIIGRLIPAGSGFPGSEKHQKIAEIQEEKERAAAARQEGEGATTAQEV